MGGRRFDVPNKDAPECVERMAETVPACFERKVWRLYLLDCYRLTLNAAAERARMQRGEVPPYCEDCSRTHAEAMRARMRCRPPVGALTPFSPTPAGASEPAPEAL